MTAIAPTFRVDVRSFVRESKKILDEMDRKKRRVLIRQGSLVRTVARRSVRRRKAASAPGSPPSHHLPGDGGLKLIFYRYDRSSDSVVVGPVRFASGAGVAIPNVVEFGGTSRIRRKRSDRSELGPGKRVRIAARPFMNPAYKSQRAKLLEIWGER